jgi:hypothetical protein
MRFELFAGETAAARSAAAECKTTLDDGVKRFPLSIEFARNQLDFLANCELEEFRDVARAEKMARSFSDEVLRKLDSGLTTGIVMLRSGRLPEAIQRLELARSTNPIQARAYLALALLHNGDEATALATMPSDEEWDDSLLEQRVMKNQIIREFQKTRQEARK